MFTASEIRTGEPAGILQNFHETRQASRHCSCYKEMVSGGVIETRKRQKFPLANRHIFAGGIHWRDLMFLEQKGFLKPDEVGKLVELSRHLKFVDGRATNPDNSTKVNQQADSSDPGFGETSRIVMDAFERSWEFQSFALPVKIASPMLSRYEPGMRYGPHADWAFMNVNTPSGPTSLRSDLSCTVFLSDPASYLGGELVLHLGTRPIVIKGKPGEAFIYPSTTLHEVRPVQSGVRLVSLTFIESRIADNFQRHLLFELTDVLSLEGLKMDWLSRVRMEVALQSLQRLWSA